MIFFLTLLIWNRLSLLVLNLWTCLGTHWTFWSEWVNPSDYRIWRLFYDETSANVVRDTAFLVFCEGDDMGTTNCSVAPSYCRCLFIATILCCYCSQQKANQWDLCSRRSAKWKHTAVFRRSHKADYWHSCAVLVQNLHEKRAGRIETKHFLIILNSDFYLLLASALNSWKDWCSYLASLWGTSDYK